MDQFRVLYRVFLMRVVELELMSSDGDPDRLLAQVAAGLAGVSILFSLPLLMAGGALHMESWGMMHVLIATTMAVVGLFSVLSWESLTPDRRDVLVLGILPIRTALLFGAKIAAVMAALGLVVASLNAMTGLLFPLVLAAPKSGGAGLLRALAAYWMTMALAGLFSFGLVMGVQGVAAQLLPRQMYLRASSVMQVVGFGVCVGMYFLEPSFSGARALEAPENQRLLAWLPSYWFVGLFQQLNGTMAAAFVPLAARAWMGLEVAVGGSAAILLGSYLRTLRRMVESPDIQSVRGRRPWWPVQGMVQAAVLAFSVRTVLRSKQHRLLTSFYLGVGFAAVFAYGRLALGHRDVRAESGRAIVASVTVLLVCVAAMGMRVLLPMPISLGANWIFRMTELIEVREYVRAARRALLAMSVVPVWVGTAVVLLTLWPVGLAVEHLILLGLLSACVVEASLLGFWKIPFACSYLPGKANVHCVFWVSVLLLLPVVYESARWEQHLLERFGKAFLLMLSLGLVWAGVWWRGRVLTAEVPRLRFEEMEEPEVVGLMLGRG